MSLFLIRDKYNKACVEEGIRKHRVYRSDWKRHGSDSSTENMPRLIHNLQYEQHAVLKTSQDLMIEAINSFRRCYEMIPR